jgi:hypothetical protein
MSFSNFCLRCLFFVLGIFILGTANIQPQEKSVAPLSSRELIKAAESVPEPLSPWIPWVIRSQREMLCPFFAQRDWSQSNHRCVFPSRLVLSVTAKGATFRQVWRVFLEGIVRLPGDDKHWPLDVLVDGLPAPVVGSREPTVMLSAGEHQVTGVFHWDSIPEALAVPQDTGLVELTINQKPVTLPERDVNGQIVFRQEMAGSSSSDDNLEIQVFRNLIDDVPYRLVTLLRLNIAGRSREVVVGPVLPQDFSPISLRSDLPVKMRPDGKLAIQLRAGQWTAEVTARSNGPQKEIKRPAADASWPEEEVWVFTPNEPLRSAAVAGLGSMDTSLTMLPVEWKKLAAYSFGRENSLTIAEQQRGDQSPPPDQLELERTMWLDFSGEGYSMLDFISGNSNRSVRFEASPPMRLTHVNMNGEDFLITRRTKDGPDGFELPASRINLVSESRVEPRLAKLAVSGWAADFKNIHTTLHLPPGWRLFHAFGADQVSESWFARWGIFDAFIVIVFSLVIWRLLGGKTALAALAMLVFVLPEEGAPQYLWLLILPVFAFDKFRHNLGRWKKWAAVYSWVCAVFFVAGILPFAIQQIERHVFPSLEHSHQSLGELANIEQQRNMVGGNLEKWGVGVGSVLSRNQRGVFSNFLSPRGSIQNQYENMPISAGEKAKNEQETSELDDVGGRGINGKLGKEPLDYRYITPAEVSEEKDALINVPEPGLVSPAAPPPPPPPPPAQPQVQQASPMAASHAISLTKNRLTDHYSGALKQVGQGVPAWEWNSVDFHWVGDVGRGQKLSLWLFSPATNLFLCFVRLILVGIIGWMFVMAVVTRQCWERWKSDLFSTRRVAGLLLVLFAIGTLSERGLSADFPDKDLLRDLQQEVLKAPKCMPQCADIARMVVDISPGQLQLQLFLHSQARTIVPLPGNRTQWLPHAIAIEGSSGTPGILQESDGTLFIQTAIGSNKVLLTGVMPQRDAFELHLPIKPHFVEIHGQGWTVTGVHPDGIPDEHLIFTRSAHAAAKDNEAVSTFPPFLQVERRLELGLKWSMKTRVTRLAKSNGAVFARIPLLEGESVTTPGIVEKGEVAVSIAPTKDSFEWNSSFAERDKIFLKAAEKQAWTEIWRLETSSFWHVELEGIPPKLNPGDNSRISPVWRPWPGETVTIKVERPIATEGQKIAIDAANLLIKPARRSLEGTLQLHLRSNQGGQQAIKFPQSAVVESVLIDGVSQAVRREGDTVRIAVKPGLQAVKMDFHMPVGLMGCFRSPQIDLGMKGVQGRISVQVPEGHWLLFAAGRGLGPTILFWFYLIVLAAVAFFLSKIKVIPLTFRQWILLSLGLTQASDAAKVIIIGFVLFMVLRRYKAAGLRPIWFDLMQIAAGVWGLLTVICLYNILERGFAGIPLMNVIGNGSNYSTLHWFSDRIHDILASVSVITVPLFVYRALMLIWALWLAWFLWSFARWTWKSFGEGGYWRAILKDGFWWMKQQNQPPVVKK